MKKYFRLFYDIEFYKELMSKKGHPIRQIFILILISTFIYSSFAGVSIMDVVTETKDAIVTEINDFKFENGKLSVTDNEEAIIIEDTQDDGILVIDTKDKLNESIIDDYNLAIYINSERVVYKKSEYETRIIDFEGLNWGFNKSDVVNFLDKVKKYVPLIIIPVLLYQLIAKWIYVLVVGLVGMIVLKMMNIDVDFKYIFKISAYIITIPTILTIINIVLLNYLIPLMSEFNLIVIVAYFVIIGKNLNKDKSLNTEDNNDKIN
jgi:hypothetical protein